MRKTSHPFLSLALITLLLLPFLASAQTSLTSSSTQATSTPNNSNGGGGTSGVGTAIGVGIGIGVAAIGINALSQRLLGTSFGGRVATVIPCSGGMFHITIIPAGLLPIAYIWTPATITYTVGPPIIPGMQLLGRADVPFVCFIGGGFFSSPIPLYGLRMQMVGTSAPL